MTTGGEAIRDFLKGLRGTIHVTFEEGTQATWLYEIVKPAVAEVIVCNPRMNKLLAVGKQGRPGGCPQASQAAAMPAIEAGLSWEAGSSAAEGVGAQL